MPAARGWGRGCCEGGLRRFCRGWSNRYREGVCRSRPEKCFWGKGPGPDETSGELDERVVRWVGMDCFREGNWPALG